MASKEAEETKQMYRDQAARFAGRQMTLEEFRAEAERLSLLTPEPPGVKYDGVDANGVHAEWTYDDRAADDHVLVYLHGGGFIGCSMRSHSRLAGHLARATGCRVLNVDYRLAPEHPYPAALTDAVTVCRWLVASGVPADRIAISGDSAGANLALAALLKLRDDSQTLLGAAALISPWVDLRLTGETMNTRAAVDLLVQKERATGTVQLYLAGGDPGDPYASPLYADLAGLPPLYIQVGDEETLLDDSLRLADRAKRAGVDVRIDVFPEMQHVFQQHVGRMPEADDAVARIGTFLRQLAVTAA